MHEMTVANLRSAFGGESMAHMRYLLWAEKAAADGFPNVARLFRAISRAEQAHAAGHFRAMRDVAGEAAVTAGAAFGLSSTAANLASAVSGETFEVEEVYPAFLAVAEAQGEKGAVRSMNFALAAEKLHAAMLAAAKEAVDGGEDVELGPVHVCSVCGDTFEGEALDCCPVCNAKGDRYVTFS